MGATAAIPNPTPLQFYLTTGDLNVLDDLGAIVQYVDHELVIVGDVTVPIAAYGLAIFTLPAAYRFDTDRPYNAHDDLGGYVAGRLFASGEFVRYTP